MKRTAPLQVLDEYAKRLTKKQANMLYESKMNRKYARRLYESAAPEEKTMSAYITYYTIADKGLYANEVIDGIADNVEYAEHVAVDKDDEGVKFSTGLAVAFGSLIAYLRDYGFNSSDINIDA